MVSVRLRFFVPVVDTEGTVTDDAPSVVPGDAEAGWELEDLPTMAADGMASRHSDMHRFCNAWYDARYASFSWPAEPKTRYTVMMVVD
jgi:hypothetical protein